MKFGSLTIRTTDGRSREYPIDLPSLVVGRADGNSIVIEDLSVARRHARIVIDSGRLMVEDLGSASGTFIDGQRIPPSTLSLVGDDQVVRFGDVEAVYTAPHTEEEEPAPQPAGLPFAANVPVAPAASVAGLRVVLSVPPQPIQPGGAPAEATLIVQNLGRVVDELTVVVEDLPAPWVKVGLPRLVLRPGEQAEVPITITPPRQSASRAGDYDFNVSVTSRETGREGVANGHVVVLPFEDTKLALQPVRAKRNFRLTATNEGNAHATYALSGVDEEEAFDYDFAKPNLELAAGQTASLPFKVNRRKHHLFGAATTAPFIVVATPTTDRGTKAEVHGQLVVAPPLEPTKRPAMFMAVLALLVLGALAFFLLPSDKSVKAVGTEDAYAGVHLCDKDGKPTDALKQEEAAATSTTTTSGGQIPKSSNTSGGPYFAQNDPRWANDEYAKAGDPEFGPDWCGTTIAQCGCAMTSVTTVMALYNILTMPDGSDLTPQAVNDWFNGNARKTARGWVSQGYIYGDVIWTAANQLSGEIAKIKPGSPTIKFSRTGTGSDEEIRTELKAGRPIILEVPGHWISAVGIDQDGKILINDPFYRDRKTLDAYAGKVKSSVLFEPSDDLSAVVITVPADERVRVTNVHTGQQVGTLNTGSQEDAKNAAKNDIPGASYSARSGWRDPTCIASPPPPGSGTNQIVLPGNRDDYKIEVLDTAGGTASVAIHTYDKTGEPSVTTLDNQGSVVANVGYDPTAGAPTVQQLDEQPQADSSSDRIAGKTATTAAQSPTATASPSATASPEATPTQGPVTTILSLSISPGAKVVNIGSTTGFGLGDVIRFSPGAANEEDNTIVGFGSFILATPLKYAHSAGEQIVRIAGVPGGGAPPPPTSQDIPPPDGVKLNCTTVFSTTPRQATLICAANIGGTFTTTRWTIDGRVQSQFSGQTVVLQVFTQDATTALAVSACNVTVCVSDATTQAIRFPVTPNGQVAGSPTPTPPPVVTPTPRPPSTGIAATCQLSITLTPDATITCSPLTSARNFSSITWEVSPLTPSTDRPRPEGAPFKRTIVPSDLTPDASGKADVLITATMCTASTTAPANDCSVSPPATVSVPYATTTLSVLPATVNLGNTLSMFAVIKGPVVPNGGTVRFTATDSNGNVTPMGLDQKVQLFPGFAFAQLSVATDAAGLQENQDYDIRAVYSGSTNTFGGPSDPVSIHVDPHIEDTCNGLDDNGDGRVDENCLIVGDTPGGVQITTEDAGAGTILSGVNLSGLTSDVNGLGQMTYRAGPNAPISTSIDATRQATSDGTDPFCANCTRQVYVGVSGNNASTPPVAPAGPLCELNQSLNDFPSTGTAKATFTNSILLTPPQPGLYYLRATSSLQSGCGQPDVGPPDKSIARIAVKGPTKTDNIQVTRPPKPGDPAPTTTKLGDHVTLAAQVEYQANNKVQVQGNVAFCDGGSNFTKDDPCGGGRLLQTVPLTTVMVGNIPTRQAVLDLDTSCLFDSVCTGMATATVPPVGDHSITAHLLDGGAYPNEFYIFSSSAPLTLHIDAAATNATLTLSSATITLGDQMAFNAAIGPGTFGPFAGTVYFCDTSAVVSPSAGACGAARELGSATVSGPDLGVGSLATFDTATFYGPPLVALGDHAIIAVYKGGNNYGDSTSPSQTVHVNPIPATVQVSVLDSNGNPAGPQPLGSLLTLKADLGPLTNGSGRFGDFTGQVHFKVDGNELVGSPKCLATAGDTSVTLQLNTASLYGAAGGAAAVGPHSVTASYERNTACGAAAGNYANSTNASAPFSLTASQTTTTITSSAPVDPRVSDSFTVAAQVTGGSFGNITGTVEFREDTTVLCSGRLSGDAINGFRANCSVDAQDFVPPLIRSDHSITAYYLGDGNNYGPSTSAPQTGINVTQAVTSVSFRAPASAKLGVATSLSATVSSSGNFGSFSGTVDFKDGTTVIASAAINANGTVSASIDWSALPAPQVGTHTLVASYVAPDSGNYASAVSASSNMNVTAADVTLLLSADSTTVSAGQTITFTASASGNFGTPTGTVTLKDGNTTLGSGALDGTGVATIPLSALGAGTYSVVASLPAAGNYLAGQSSPAIAVTVLKPTVTTLTIPATETLPAGFTATVDVSCPSCKNGNGFTGLSVNILDVTGATPVLVQTVTLANNGSGTASNIVLSGGSHTLIARFLGGGGFGVSDSSAATINVVNPTTTTVSLDKSAIVPPASVQLTASVASGGSGTGITGTVEFLLDGAPFSPAITATVTNGNASVTTQAIQGTLGNHSITAHYQGTATFAQSTSAAATITVQSDVSTAIRFSATSPVDHDTTVTITADVTALTSGAGTINTGKVQFRDGSTDIGAQVNVSNGHATLQVNGTSGVDILYGARTISAHYVGAGNFADSFGTNETSSSITVTASTQTVISAPATAVHDAAFNANVTVTCTDTSTCGEAGLIAGTVDFFDGATPLGSASLDATGHASKSITLSTTGNHTITATFTPAAGSNYVTSTTSTGAVINIT